MDGWGFYKFRNGNEYHGQWEEDRMEGEGIYTSAIGNHYEETFLMEG